MDDTCVTSSGCNKPRVWPGSIPAMWFCILIFSLSISHIFSHILRKHSLGYGMFSQNVQTSPFGTTLWCSIYAVCHCMWGAALGFQELLPLLVRSPGLLSFWGASSEYVPPPGRRATSLKLLGHQEFRQKTGTQRKQQLLWQCFLVVSPCYKWPRLPVCLSLGHLRHTVPWRGHQLDAADSTALGYKQPEIQRDRWVGGLWIRH